MCLVESRRRRGRRLGQLRRPPASLSARAPHQRPSRAPKPSSSPAQMSDPPKPSLTLPQSGRPAQIGRPATSPSLPGQPRAPSGASATSGGLPAAASPDLPKNRGRDWLAGRLKALEHAQTVGLPPVWAHSASSCAASRLTISAVATPLARPAIRPHRRAHPPPSRRRAAAVRPVDCSAKRRLAC
jgi:hypothetical protein